MRANAAPCSSGHSTASLSACLSSAWPPMSSHRVRGTFSSTSRSALGRTTDSAARTSSMRTRPPPALPPSPSAPPSSVASVAWRCSAARSAPTKPAVHAASSLRSDGSSACGARLKSASRMARRPGSLGTPTSTSASNRPGRRNAASSASGRLVAPSTTSGSRRACTPSICVRSTPSSLASLPSPSAAPRAAPSASISSMNRIAGAAARASSKAAVSFASASPRLDDRSSAAPNAATCTPRLPAIARAMSVFPVPGGPCSSSPVGGGSPTDSYRPGARSGSSTI
mmetsp:Transcript_87867/g.264252  ORF Transcript_87867/g.264252 Transcript_87867/m.264252 type:complete len:284 (+) Transcript_87867:1299-2150(+)